MFSRIWSNQWLVRTKVAFTSCFRCPFPPGLTFSSMLPQIPNSFLPGGRKSIFSCYWQPRRYRSNSWPEVILPSCGASQVIELDHYVSRWKSQTGNSLGFFKLLLFEEHLAYHPTILKRDIEKYIRPNRMMKIISTGANASILKQNACHSTLLQLTHKNIHKLRMVMVLRPHWQLGNGNLCFSIRIIH